jgi:hypothetical protein
MFKWHKSCNVKLNEKGFLKSKEKNAMCNSIPKMVVVLVAYLMMASGVAFAYPSFGESCSQCHGTNVGGTNPNKMSVTGFDTLLDLGTQLDGNMRGELSTFTASPGDTVTLQMTVTDNSQAYGVQLKRLYKPGQQVSALNFLTSPMYGTGSVPPWVDDGGDPVLGPQYFYQGVIDAGVGSVYNFDLILDPGTPLDVYDLEFAIAGGSGFSPSSWYQDEHFYLQIVEPPSFDIADLNQDTFVGELDYEIMVDNWASTTADASEGDIYEDDSVNAKDAGIMFSNWTGEGSFASFGTIPEPSSLILAALALCNVIAYRTRPFR